MFTNKVAIVTGGASGIGAALAKALAARGARVVIADRQLELAESVASAIRATNGSAFARELDVRDANAVGRAVDDTVAQWGAVHYFFNNAGIGIGGEVEYYSAREWEDVFDVNLRGVTNGIQAAYPVMIRQREGHIINTASMAGLITTPFQVSYSASKHAVVGLSKALRVEARRHNVHISVLCPGVIRTPILAGGKYGRRGYEGLSEDIAQKFWKRLRPMDPDVFARQALTCISRNQAIIVLPRWWKLFWALERLSPDLGMRFAEANTNVMRRRLEAAGVRAIKHSASSPNLASSASPQISRASEPGSS